MQVKRIICLANSKKNGGHCLAGKELSGRRPWIRPVGSGPTQELHGIQVIDEQSHRYVRPLQVLDLKLVSHAPTANQRENWQIVPGTRPQALDREYAWEEIDEFCDQPSELWISGYQSSGGKNNRVPESSLIGRGFDSLYLIRVDSLLLEMRSVNTTSGYDKSVVDGVFSHAGRDYKLRVTDPQASGFLKRNAIATLEIGSTFLTISLAPPFGGYFYKLIAAVIPQQAIWKT